MKKNEDFYKEVTDDPSAKKMRLSFLRQKTKRKKSEKHAHTKNKKNKFKDEVSNNFFGI